MKFSTSTIAILSTTAFAVSVTETDTEATTDIVTITSCNSDVKSCKYRSSASTLVSYYTNRTSTVSSVSVSSNGAPGSVYAAAGVFAAGAAALLL
ncbi:unnamed protein product [Ambrosiozyma monospora]|uniref:Unnamed protein product n=1 Tax=Ambrosiozyma monospora TaxID=43982 RepID=A0A9W7DIW0_AMBMO|nr:unnamed protein product [Ambrosiozyma monospora]